MKRDVQFAKFVLLVNGLVPGALLAWDWLLGQAGANPVNYAIRTTGMLALVFLTLSLSVTPLRRITGIGDLFHFRRALGLYAFFYGVTHFCIFFILDRQLSISSTIAEVFKRPYLVIGMMGLSAMAPLAATSFNSMIKKLGPKRWKRLHRLAYVAAMLGVVHFYMLVKSDIRLPVIFGVIVGFLLLYRVVVFFAERAEKVGSERRAFPMEPLNGNGRWSGKLKVEKIVQETGDVRTFRLMGVNGEGGGGKLPFEYLPGQYLTLVLEIGGKQVKRTYTMASTPTRGGSCELTIKREAKGRVSGHMHEMVKEGDVVEAIAPAGKFVFTGRGMQGANGVVLIAGGVGITPVMSILRYLMDTKWSGPIYLLYSNKTEGDIIFRQEIEEMQRANPNLRATMTLTRETGEAWKGARGRIGAGLIAQAVPNVRSALYYMCGPAEMLRETREVLMKLGVEAGNVFVESFGAGVPARMNGGEMAAAGDVCKVAFATSGKEAETRGERSLLEIAEELGVAVDSECRSGICGTCKCRLISGSVKMDTQEALTEEDRWQGVVLLCQARALEDVVVEA